MSVEDSVASWSTPPAEGTASADGERYRLEWYPSRGVTKRALFRLDGDTAILQHVRAVILRQRGTTRVELDPDATLADVPAPLRAVLRDRGFTLREDR